MSLEFQLGLLFGYLGRSSPKFKSEGLSINIPKLGTELALSPEEVTRILLYAAEQKMLELTLTQATVKGIQTVVAAIEPQGNADEIKDTPPEVPPEAPQPEPQKGAKKS